MTSLFLLKLVIYLLLFVSLCVASPLTLEQRVQQLEQNNLEMKETLETRITNLEVKVTQLEEKLNHHELVEPQQIVQNINQQNAIHRSCQQARRADSSLQSGMYLIDPDGNGVGDDPIRVHCDMTTGVTSILHDSESETDVGRCTKPGCYSRKINYEASDKQIAALVELSTECHQSIRYDCVSAPLNVNGVAFSWWNDRNGNDRYFWSGSNSSVQRSICQCGLNGKCIDDFLSCNCDSVLQTQQSDSGIITDKTILPVTRLNFGRILPPNSFGSHTLGRLECSGQVAVVPKSCADLWRIGHSLSGLYSVMGTEKVESVYCDFTKLPTESGFQTWIGQVDVKSLPIYFYVQRNTSFNTSNTPISFELARLNIGNAMNLTSGKFTAPRAGIYSFSFTGLVHFPASSSRLHLDVGIYLNGNRIALPHADEVSSVYQYDSLSLHSTLSLQAGDQIWMQIYSLATGVYLIDSDNHFTHFSGWLLEENISQSLTNL